LKGIGLETEVVEWLGKYSSLIPLTLETDSGEANTTESSIFYVEDHDEAYNIVQEAINYADEQGKPIYWAVGGGDYSSADEITKLMLKNPDAVIIGIEPKPLQTPQHTNLDSYQFPQGSWGLAVKARLEDFGFAQGRIDLIEIASPEPYHGKQVILDAVEMLKPGGSLKLIIREDEDKVGRLMGLPEYASYRDFFEAKNWTEENGWPYSERFYSPDQLKNDPTLAPRSGQFGYIGGKLIQSEVKEIVLTKPNISSHPFEAQVFEEK
jgi:hypothetical protein